ncbi:MAG TPA: hypothetical protein VHR66_23180 [Gemmataceae bacterium]|jgi:hypothetical protein|nr:hypothetical protein [Gemmataceae bacterium]
MFGRLRFIALGLVVLSAGCATPWRPEPMVKDFGLGHLIHPLDEPDRITLPANCRERPDSCGKDHVYVFAINGLNPLCTGNFNGMCCYLKDQGFTNTYFGQPYTSFWFPDEIREIRERDPQAKIVLIGFSWGANCVRSLAHKLDDDGTPVDLLVYLVGDTIWNTPYSRPPNVRRIVNIRAQGLILLGGDLLFNGADIDGARNEMLECRHILAPSRKETLTIMMEELLVQSCAPVSRKRTQASE